MTIDQPMPEKMRAFVLTGHGDMDKLVFYDDWPLPTLEAGEVLIQVRACGLNNTDVNVRTGWYSKAVGENTTESAFANGNEADAAWGGASITFPRIQGADVAGVVVAAGAGADASLVGKRVLIDTWLRNWDTPHDLGKCGYFGSEVDGGFAEYTKIDQRNVHPVDCELTDAELATFATSSITAENLLHRAQVGEGDIVLISGASGGVGSALIQLANRRGATTVAMASESKHEQLAELAPAAILPRAPENLKAALMNATGRNTVTVVADVVGGAGWPGLIDVLERGGRYTCAGAIAGPVVAFDLRTFYLRDLTFTGATVVPPGMFADLVGYIERGEIKPVLAKTYPLEQLHAAQTAFIQKKHIGNIVVTHGTAA